MNFAILVLLLIFGAIIVGAILVAVGYMLHDTIYSWILKRRLKKLDVKLLDAPGPQLIDERRYKEDDREFRAFQRIRDIAQRSGGIEKPISSSTEPNKFPERRSLQNGPAGFSTFSSTANPTDKRESGSSKEVTTRKPSLDW